MKKNKWCLILLVLITFEAISQTRQSYLVWFKSSAHENKFIADFENKFIQAKKINPNHLIWKIQFDEEQVISKYTNDTNIKFIQTNHQVSLRNKTPNDPDFSKQYHLLNNGQNGGKINSDIKASEAWSYYTGGNSYKGDTIVVAIVDAGCDIEHEDLKENIYINYREIPNDGIDNDTNGYIDDYKGYNVVTNSGNISKANHGTFIAGIIGAKGNNNLGIAGINWNIKMLPIEANTGDEAGVVAAYLYIYDQRKLYNQSNGKKGSFIVASNSSFGVFQVKVSDFPIWCAMYDTLGKVGVLSVGATINNYLDIGNYGDVPSMCASNFLIMATNSDKNDELNAAGYSKQYIDLSAPATDIFSTETNNTYDYWSGTSFAAPQIVATAALLYHVPCSVFSYIYSNFPDSAALLIKNYILNGVDTIASHQNKTLSGGRLNIFNSIQLLEQKNCYQLKINNISDNNTNFIYPNPANNILYIIYSETEKNRLVSLIDISGKTILQTDLGFIDVSSFANGIYFIKIGQVYKKIMIQH